MQVQCTIFLRSLVLWADEEESEVTRDAVSFFFFTLTRLVAVMVHRQTQSNRSVDDSL